MEYPDVREVKAILAQQSMPVASGNSSKIIMPQAPAMLQFRGHGNERFWRSLAGGGRDEYLGRFPTR
jgi:hypothetical protein